MPEPRTPTAQEVFNALDILHGAPSTIQETEDLDAKVNAAINSMTAEQRKAWDAAKLKRLKKREAKNVP